MKDAMIGILAAVALLCCLCVPRSENAPTLQGVFEDIEKRKADKLMQEQIEQAKRTREAYEASVNASK